jgi:hypothetical protein
MVLNFKQSDLPLINYNLALNQSEIYLKLIVRAGDGCFCCWFDKSKYSYKFDSLARFDCRN